MSILVSCYEQKRFFFIRKISDWKLNADWSWSKLSADRSRTSLLLMIYSSSPETGPRTEAWLPDISRPYHQVIDYLHSPKQRVKFLSKLFIVGVEVWPFLHIIEGQLALFVVQEHPNFPGFHHLWQLGGRDCQGFQVCAPLHTQGQVSCICVEGSEALPSCWCFCHTKPPIPLTHLYLPVVAPTGVAHLAYSTPPAIKTLSVLWDVLPLQATPHVLFITGDNQVCVGGLGVQCHILCEEQ